ncbi:hypothetical protein QFC22_001566 [Naganishia vaughanmartiniae]|uniref:Uncharacterized protein n=1 Tax=Naganishia vaughanmartiniae TaxID=1424756 RepID=A0ACC2XHF6_9TREE|nr:hypothetical protein QFC22_001566 [Naganishia vaughanmartiniae]
MRSPLPLPLVRIPARTRVFPLGSAALPTTIPLLQFRNGLNIPSDGEYGLAIVGQGEGRRRLVQTLLSKYRFHPHPPAPGIFPYAYNWARESHAQEGAIHDPIQPPPSIRHLTFSKPSLTGEFTDFTARYGALQEEDADTLLQFFRGSLFPSPKEDAITAVASILRIEHLLHLPLVALSSGQTRRSRIAAGFLAAPRMLIVEDPFAGLDVQSRQEIAVMLGRVNSRGIDPHTAGRGADDTEGQGMRLVLSLRGTATIGLPRYVTHVARVTDGEVETLSKEEYVERVKDEETTHHVVPDPGSKPAVAQSVEPSATKPVVDVQGVSVTYGETKVSPHFSLKTRSLLALSAAESPVISGTRQRLMAHPPR